MKKIFKFLTGTVIAGFAFCLLLCGFSRLMCCDPDGGEIPLPEEAEIESARELRDTRIDNENPVVIHREVDYSEREAGDWYPKSEAPILRDLVVEGKLPPVAERVGSEPCVLEGIDGIGTYGGTWIRIANSANDVGVISNRMSYALLFRYSPYGHPLVPHVAKGYEVTPDNREFTIYLRKGMKWSDGEPYTADDILYWWEHECNDTDVMATPPAFMKIHGRMGTVEKLDTYAVKISFPEPNGLFPVRLTAHSSRFFTNCPEHYLKQYHPTLGDEELITEYMEKRKLPNKLAAYRDIKNKFNPAHPRLWPWIYRTFKSNPPQTFVRNPYYWIVDTEGNQLPYVDRILFEVKSPNMLGVSVANGEVTMQARHVRYDQYTLMMSQKEKYGYSVYHWYPGDRSQYVISPNLNRRIEPDKPDTLHKHRLLNNKRFRQALSLAIDRKSIIDAEYNGQAEPAQLAPGPMSFFYNESLYNSFTEYDPERAEKLLDELDLTERDFEGFRTFPDGSRMHFFLYYCSFTGIGPGQFVVEDWADVGVRVTIRERSRRLFYTEKAALKHDFNVWIGNNEYFPLIQPRYFLPVYSESNYAIGFGRWYDRGGLYGAPLTDRAHGCIEPPADHPLRKAMMIYERTLAKGNRQEQQKIFDKALDIAAENLWTINICTPPPVLAVVKNGFKNVPRDLVACWDFQTPGNAGIETFYFEDPQDSAGAVEKMKSEILNVTLPPDAPSLSSDSTSAARTLASLLKWSFAAIVCMLTAMTGVRHPYIGRRLLIMIPTLLIMSVITFTVIQLPPGDYVTTRIMQLQESGDEADLQQIEDLKQLFFLEESMPMRYMRWLGLPWFLNFDKKNRGLLQGNMGRSMETLRPVNQIVGDRILLTVFISLGTILFTWAFAIPIGIYSAVRQYSISDYVLTFMGFIGMCVPSFLLALLLMYVSGELLGIPVSGLFSSQFGAQPEWDWPKLLDLLKHIWVPIVVLGVRGTAGMIRIMRANLLDELKKPYVVTARAKGVRPIKLLFKYPVRMALNPFISGIGSLFPRLISGGAIVAMVLSLPTVGPLMLSALMSEDMYLAGSMLMVLSILGVVGTLVSDLLLLGLDPRIRMTGGSSR